jgi:hypothetical protein
VEGMWFMQTLNVFVEGKVAAANKQLSVNVPSRRHGSGATSNAEIGVITHPGRSPRAERGSGVVGTGQLCRRWCRSIVIGLLRVMGGVSTRVRLCGTELDSGKSDSGVSMRFVQGPVYRG